MLATQYDAPDKPRSDNSSHAEKNGEHGARLAHIIRKCWLYLSLPYPAGVEIVIIAA